MESNQLLQFGEDWIMYNTLLGEGSYGEVRLIVNKNTNEKIACKIMNIDNFKIHASDIKKETSLHSLLRHENIIRYYAMRKEVSKIYIFLEYAAGGELFQQIEPGYGMPAKTAQNYMRQLLQAVKYLHVKGVAHRDIKPENILLSADGVLKLSDFGLATIFRYKGKERLLDKRCGTKPYLAPEVIKGPYHAEPADIWSCGCVLVAMLTGELVWSGPFEDCADFTRYREGSYLSSSPWNRLGNTPLSFITKFLCVDPKERITVDKAEKHPWMTYDFSYDVTDSSKDNEGKNLVAMRRASMMEQRHVCRDMPDVAVSQPILPARPVCLQEIVENQLKTSKKDICFSQPSHNENLIIPSEMQFTQTPITKDNFDHFVKRLTRFFVKCPSEEHAVELVCAVLDAIHYTWKIDAAGSVTVSTVDGMKNQLIFKIASIKMDGRILLDFRLSKGCGLEFKKKFIKIKDCLSTVVSEV